MRLGDHKCEHLNDNHLAFRYEENGKYFYTCRKCGGTAVRDYLTEFEKKRRDNPPKRKRLLLALNGRYLPSMPSYSSGQRDLTVNQMQ